MHADAVNVDASAAIRYVVAMQSKVKPESCEPDASEDAISGLPGIAISGADLARTILNHPHGGVDAALRLAGQGECDWLECKAGMVSLPQERREKENDSDAYWHVAEAIIALANSRGGVVLVGVEDKTLTAVSLQSADPRGVISKEGLEAYRRREIYERVNPGNGEWRTGLKGIWRLEDGRLPDGCIEVIGLKYQEQDIAGILVHPVSECIRVWKGEVEQILRRATGQVGKVESIKGSKAMDAYEATRPLPTADLVDLRDHFLAEVGIHDRDAELEAAIAAYYERLARENADLMEAFTPLDAEECVRDEHDLDDLQTPVPREVYEPEAEEWFAPDEDWSGDEDDENDVLGGNDDQDDEDELEADGAEGDEESDSDEDDEFAPHREPRRGGVFALLADEPRAVLLGEPGGGKTTCLKRLALDARESYEYSRKVAIFVPLSRWIAGGGLWGLIQRCSGLRWGQVERLINDGRCWLLLDALNECPDSLRNAAIIEICDLLKRFPSLSVIISARTQQDIACFSVPVFVVQALSRCQQEHFLSAYNIRSAKATKLLERIHDQPGGHILAANPLVLRMIIDVVGAKSELPVGRASLYRRWLKLWYDREKGKVNRAGSHLRWNLKTVLSSLAAIAYESRRNGKRIIDISMAQSVLKMNLSSESEITAFIDYMEQGPLIQRDEDVIRFRHETFQEYLCAEAILGKSISLENLGEDVYNTWAMPLVYSVELSNNCSSVISTAMWQISPWMGAAVSERVFDCSRLSPPMQRLLSCFVGGNLPPDFERSARCKSYWYRPDEPMKYLVAIRPSVRNLFNRIESLRLCTAKTPSMVLHIFRNSLAFPEVNDAIRRRIDSFYKIKNNCSVRQAVELVGCGFLKTCDLSGRQEEWKRDASQYEKKMLIDAGIMTLDDFSTPKPKVLNIRKVKTSLVTQIISQMVEIPAGSFIMGDNRVKNESPCHRVSIAKPFLLAKSPVTQMLWEEVRGFLPIEINRLELGGMYPIIWVSIDDIRHFIQILNCCDQSVYFDLPTEAEWEYACRAGTSTNYCFGDDPGDGQGPGLLEKYAWTKRNSRNVMHPVGELRSNKWGLFDMHGLVYETVRDGARQYSKKEQYDPIGPANDRLLVARGGYFGRFPLARSSEYEHFRSASRQKHEKSKRVSFRLACYRK